METDSKLETVVEVWKATVEVQMHFSDIELKIRSIAAGGLGVLLGANALAYREGLAVSIGSVDVPISVFVLVAAAVFWGSLYFMDRFWYHRILMGAIYHGQGIEEKYEDSLPELSLTKSIGKESPVVIFGREWHSKNKMDFFYGMGGHQYCFLRLRFRYRRQRQYLRNRKLLTKTYPFKRRTHKFKTVNPERRKIRKPFHSQFWTI